MIEGLLQCWALQPAGLFLVATIALAQLRQLPYPHVHLELSLAKCEVWDAATMIGSGVIRESPANIVRDSFGVSNSSAKTYMRLQHVKDQMDLLSSHFFSHGKHCFDAESRLAEI